MAAKNVIGLTLTLKEFEWTIIGDGSKAGRFHAMRRDDDNKAHYIEVRRKRGGVVDVWEEVRD